MASTSTRTETIVSEGLFDRDESETVSVAEPEPHQLRLETTVDLGEIIDRPEEGKYFWTTGNDPGVEHVQIIDWGGTGEVHAVFSPFLD